MNPKLSVARLLALLPDPVLRLRALRLARHGIPVLDLRIEPIAFRFFGRSVVERTGLHFNDVLGRCSCSCFGWAGGCWPDGRHQVVIGSRGDLAADRSLRACGVAVAGAAVHHALGHLGNARCRVGTVWVGGLRWKGWRWDWMPGWLGH